MKKQIGLVLIAALAVLALAACGGKEETGMQIPNPWTEVESLEAAAETAGYTFTVPAAAAEAADLTVRLMNGGEITQADCTLDGREVTFRKGTVSAEEISGVYDEFEAETQADVNGTEVTLKGTGDTAYVAQWTEGDYAFSIYCADGVGRPDMLDLIAETH